MLTNLTGIGVPLTEEQAEPLLLRAIELGCVFWDTAVCLTDEVYLSMVVGPY